MPIINNLPQGGAKELKSLYDVIESFGNEKKRTTAFDTQTTEPKIIQAMGVNGTITVLGKNDEGWSLIASKRSGGSDSVKNTTNPAIINTTSTYRYIKMEYQRHGNSAGDEGCAGLFITY